MQVVIKNPVKFEDVNYVASEPTLADDLALRMVNAGVATRKIPLPQGYPITTVSDAVNNITRQIKSALAKPTPFRQGKFLKTVPNWLANDRTQQICQANGNLYARVNSTVAVQQTGAAAPAWTTANAGIADNTVNWLYIGPCPTPDPQYAKDLPTIAWQAAFPAALTKKYKPQDNSIDSANGVWRGDLFCNFLGGQWGKTTAAWQGGIQDSYLGSGCQEFEVDADQVYLYRSANVSAFDQSALSFYILVNDVPYYPLGANFDNSSSGMSADVSGWLLTFPSAEKRRITIYTRYAWNIAVAPRFFVKKPPVEFTFKMAFEGDSFGDGGAPADGYFKRAVALGLNLGAKNILNVATGGSGYIWNNAGATTNRQQRIARLIQHAPDLLFASGTYWDNNAQGYTTAQRLAAYKTYYDTLFAALPNLIVVVLGGRGDGTAADAYIDTEMQSFVSGYGNPKMIFIPTCPDLEGYFTITGDGDIRNNGTAGIVTYTTTVGQGSSQWALGNTVVDGHPNVRGQLIYYARDFACLVAAINQLS